MNEDTGDVELEASSGAITPGRRVRYRVGEGQAWGVATQYGGPYVGFMVVKEALKRHMPGRLVGEGPQLGHHLHRLVVGHRGSGFRQRARGGGG